MNNQVIVAVGVLLLCSISGVQATPAWFRHAKKENHVFLQADEKVDFEQMSFGKATANNTFDPFTQHHPSDRLKCGITEKVGAHTDKYEDCPANCPYFAQNRKDTEHCTFLCVPGAECGRWNPNKPIPDTIKASKTCRGPKVAFCTTPVLDGTDNCQVCQSGFALHDGQCFFEYWITIMSVSAVFGLIFVVAIVWFVDLCCREDVNGAVVKDTCRWRDRSRIFQPLTAEQIGNGERRTTWPLSTPTWSPYSPASGPIDIAGPGMTLHFRFQVFFIIWPICVALVWVALACVHNELFILGTRKFGTPRHNCILVAWGYETQQRLMWTKVLFLAIVYVGSFISFLIFSINQLRTYEWMDSECKTMKDFALEVAGLPKIPGSYVDVEKDIENAVKKATGKTIVGVSICWDYGEEQEKVDFACYKTQAAREQAMPGAQTLADVPEPTAEMNGIHKWMYQKEKDLLGPDEDPIQDDEVKPLLEGLTTSDAAFVVFNTEEDQQDVLKDIKDGKYAVKFDGSKYGFDKDIELVVSEVGNEPSNVNWHNFGDSAPIVMVGRFFKGFFTVYVPALLVWFFCFYVPYACALYYFNYDNGAELPGYYSIIFTIVVCGGNATMYVVCDICCDIIGFRYKDTKQKTYMLMYLVACMINVFLDMGVTYYTALKIMIGLDFRTYHGERLSEIDAFTQQFETYAMQRSLGENTYAYAWPSTFFLCFVLEPFVTIWVPLYIGKIVVRTHPEIKGSCAEAYLMAFEFDMGRYADILLNVFLGILIFWFPGGYIWTLFFFMAFSHTFIYCFDHWRVLTVIPYVKIVINEVDWWAQVVMCGLCAMIMMCLVFKANCETYVDFCLTDMALIMRCGMAGLIHFIVHFLLLLYFVPMMSSNDREDNSNQNMNYAAVAQDEPRTWFSMNPVHCLRSKYLKKDSPACLLCGFGREHLLEANSKIGCYYSQAPPQSEEELDLRKSFSKMMGKDADAAKDKETP